MGWLLMVEAFSDYKKMENRVKELEEQKDMKEGIYRNENKKR